MPADADADTLGTHWQPFWLQGAIMVFLGALAVAVPALVTLEVDLYIGWLLLVSGIVGLGAALPVKNAPAFWWCLLMPALSAAVGAMLIWQPSEDLVSLRSLLAVFLLFNGVLQIVTSVVYRHAMRGSWGWMSASGLLDLALAACLVLGWPATANWAMGLLAGVNLIASGSAILMASAAARKLVESAAATAERR
jgi:uncharacterized membrane protein HdeD (DUF308 family)